MPAGAHPGHLLGQAGPREIPHRLQGWGKIGVCSPSSSCSSPAAPPLPGFLSSRLSLFHALLSASFVCHPHLLTLPPSLPARVDPGGVGGSTGGNRSILPRAGECWQGHSGGGRSAWIHGKEQGALLAGRKARAARCFPVQVLLCGFQEGSVVRGSSCSTETLLIPSWDPIEASHVLGQLFLLKMCCNSSGAQSSRKSVGYRPGLG